MSANVINAELLAKMFLAGAKNLENQKEYINELNVFPVPDGDTGTNMTLTIMSAAKEVNNVSDMTMKSVCKAMSSGSLRGARGNSGVILSQLIRGFTKVASDYDELDIAVLDAAIDSAVKTAYKAVMKPKEGTILTVASGAGTKSNELKEAGCDNLEEFIGGVIEHADYVLSTTPDMLPVLKQAGVVDSGGQGLMEVLKGAFAAFLGKEIESKTPDNARSSSKASADKAADIKFAYDSEFIIVLNGNKPFNVKNEMDFQAYLESIGEAVSIEVNDSSDKARIRLRTNDPGLALQKAIKYGMLSGIKINNLKLTDEDKNSDGFEDNNTSDSVEEKGKDEVVFEPAKPVFTEPPKKFGFIAVSVGNGINDIFKSLGVDYIISGGQTMNPSTEDMLTAIDNVNAETIFILPNNKNIVMAANQARDLTTDKTIVVIPTKTVPQGICAVINFSEVASAEDNEQAMLEAIANVKTGQITYAVRDTVIDDKEIHQGDFMGIGDKGILSVGDEKSAVTLEMVKQMADEDSELISIYYGEEVTEEEADELSKNIEELFPDADVEVNLGGQPIYYYVISVE